MKTKKFDCVQMKRAGSARIYAATKSLTVAESLRFWAGRTRDFKRQQAVAKPRTSHRTLAHA